MVGRLCCRVRARAAGREGDAAEACYEEVGRRSLRHVVCGQWRGG